MPVRTLNASDVRVLGQAKVTINSATTTNFDFGTPDDINLTALAGYKHGDKVMVVFSATTAGTTDTVSFSVQDAPDSSGSIGTPAAAVTDATLTGGTGDRRAVTAVQLQPGRPWLRCRVTSTGATDTFVASAIVLAVGPMS
jgi:hypothetical protein